MIQTISRHARARSEKVEPLKTGDRVGIVSRQGVFDEEIIGRIDSIEGQRAWVSGKLYRLCHLIYLPDPDEIAVRSVARRMKRERHDRDITWLTACDYDPEDLA